MTPCITEFLVRMKGAPQALPTVALISLAGDKWILDTMLEIGAYLRRELPEATIIA